MKNIFPLIFLLSLINSVCIAKPNSTISNIFSSHPKVTTNIYPMIGAAQQARQVQQNSQAYIPPPTIVPSTMFAHQSIPMPMMQLPVQNKPEIIVLFNIWQQIKNAFMTMLFGNKIEPLPLKPISMMANKNQKGTSATQVDPQNQSTQLLSMSLQNNNQSNPNQQAMNAVQAAVYPQGATPQMPSPWQPVPQVQNMQAQIGAPLITSLATDGPGDDKLKGVTYTLSYDPSSRVKDVPLNNAMINVAIYYNGNPEGHISAITDSDQKFNFKMYEDNSSVALEVLSLVDQAKYHAYCYGVAATGHTNVKIKCSPSNNRG